MIKRPWAAWAWLFDPDCRDVIHRFQLGLRTKRRIIVRLTILVALRFTVSSWDWEQKEELLLVKAKAKVSRMHLSWGIQIWLSVIDAWLTGWLVYKAGRLARTVEWFTSMASTIPLCNFYSVLVNVTQRNALFIVNNTHFASLLHNTHETYHCDLSH